MRFEIVHVNTTPTEANPLGNRVWEHTTGDMANLEAIAGALGFKPNGKTGHERLRPELQGKPCFDGLYGPMHGRDQLTKEDIVRYESHAAYDILSR